MRSFVLLVAAFLSIPCWGITDCQEMAIRVSLFPFKRMTFDLGGIRETAKARLALGEDYVKQFATAVRRGETSEDPGETLAVLAALSPQHRYVWRDIFDLDVTSRSDIAVEFSDRQKARMRERFLLSWQSFQENLQNLTHKDPQVLERKRFQLLVNFTHALHMRLFQPYFPGFIAQVNYLAPGAKLYSQENLASTKAFLLTQAALNAVSRAAGRDDLRGALRAKWSQSPSQIAFDLPDLAISIPLILTHPAFVVDVARTFLESRYLQLGQLGKLADPLLSNSDLDRRILRQQYLFHSYRALTLLTAVFAIFAIDDYLDQREDGEDVADLLYGEYEYFVYAHYVHAAWEARNWSEEVRTPFQAAMWNFSQERDLEDLNNRLTRRQSRWSAQEQEWLKRQNLVSQPQLEQALDHKSAHLGPRERRHRLRWFQSELQRELSLRAKKQLSSNFASFRQGLEDSRQEVQQMRAKVEGEVGRHRERGADAQSIEGMRAELRLYYVQLIDLRREQDDAIRERGLEHEAIIRQLYGPKIYRTLVRIYEKRLQIAAHPDAPSDYDAEEDKQLLRKYQKILKEVE